MLIFVERAISKIFQNRRFVIIIIHFFPGVLAHIFVLLEPSFLFPLARVSRLSQLSLHKERAVLCISSFQPSIQHVFFIISFHLSLVCLWAFNYNFFCFPWNSLLRTSTCSPRLSYYELFHYLRRLLVLFHKWYVTSHFKVCDFLSSF